MTEQPMTFHYAGFWQRFLAYVLDTLIIGAISKFLFIPILALVGLGAITADRFPESTPAILGIAIVGMSFFLIVFTIGSWLYFALMESSTNKATLGKMALGIQVVDLQGNKISFGKATGRYFAKFLSGMILWIGFIMAAFTEKKQALHDLIVGSLVVKKS